MLLEAPRLLADGSNVMIAAVANQSRVGILDVFTSMIGHGAVEGRSDGLTTNDLDFQEVIERAPQVVVIDEYAFVNPSRNPQRCALAGHQ